jgi:hypothetical protein
MRTSFIVLCFLFAPTLLSAQDTPKAALSRMAGCTLQGHIYTCSKADLERALSLASSITCISQPANHASDAALADLIRKLGKTPASANTPSDLTFILEPLLEAGVQVGPGTTDLAKLRVLLTTASGAPGKLLWIHTYNGDSSMGWPAVARATTLALHDQIRSKVNQTELPAKLGDSSAIHTCVAIAR